MAEELTARYGLAVTAIVPSAASEHARRMSAMPDVRVLERSELAADIFVEASLQTARGVIALRRPDAVGVDWSPTPGYVLATGDSVLVLATRAGLSGLLRRDDPLPSGSTSGI